jgi:hypothetical protein
MEYYGLLWIIMDYYGLLICIDMYCVYLCLVNIRINQWYVLLHPRSYTLSSWQRQIRSSCGLAGNRGSARADTSENAPSSKITGQISTNQGAHIIQRWRKMKGPDWTLKTICIAMMWIVNWVLELWSSLVNAARFIRHLASQSTWRLARSVSNEHVHAFPVPFGLLTILEPLRQLQFLNGLF